MKFILTIVGLAVSTSLIAGGSGSGGAPPPLANFDNEHALEAVTDIEVSEIALKNAILHAIENNKVDIKVGEEIVKLKPTNFDFTENTLSIKNPANGLDIRVRKLPTLPVNKPNPQVLRGLPVQN